MDKPLPTLAAAPRRPRRSQAERRAESERSLLESAAALMSEQGYGATTLEQIGQRAGYSRGLVTQRFGSKEGLVARLVEVLHRGFAMATFENPEPHRDGRSAILSVVDYYMAHIAEDLAPVRAYFVLMSESIGVIPEIRSAFVAANRQFHAHLRQKALDGQLDGSIPADIDAGKLATTLMSLATGHTLIWLVDPEIASPEQARQNIVAATERLLGGA
ncbi:MAG: TetR/AcrR family transcriptional regulator [Caulobacterales bacterium]|nr:TetR/AcrR family transcriptional regulator [Caulobacterales bacterium]